MFQIIYLLLLTAFTNSVTSEANIPMGSSSFGTVSKVVSRRKRFLIFPEGSSVQLVFCNQNHGYLQLGDIVWFGTTAALAWELPTNSGMYDVFKDQINKHYEVNRRNDYIYYLNENGKVISRKIYKRKSIINPAFAKRSVNGKEYKEQNTTQKSFKLMKKIQKNILYSDELDTIRMQYVRREKQMIYTKIESFLQTLGWSGKDCVLKMLCWAGQANKVQGLFLEEILKSIFTLPNDHSGVYNQYDDAHGSNGDCERLYTECGYNV